MFGLSEYKEVSITPEKQTNIIPINNWRGTIHVLRLPILFE